MSQDFLSAALRYAQCGLHIFPVQPRGKVPLTAHGVKDSSCAEPQIRAWWGQWPDANIGLSLDGYVAVDIDPRNGGDADLLPQKLPDTCTAKTGGGGWHYLYTANGARYAAHPAQGIDVKSGAGAYIVVEPSIHASGECYCWVDETEPWSLKPAQAPAWLAQREQPKAALSIVEGKIAEGGRNAALTSMAGSMRRRGMSPEAICAALLAENVQKCNPPLDDSDVLRIASSVSRYEPDQQPKKTPPQSAPIIKRAPLDWPVLATMEPPARKWAVKGG